MWQGPYKEGVSQSALHRFMMCRDRFWLHYIEGWRERVTYQDVHKMEFGSLFHEALEADAANLDPITAVDDYALKLITAYPSEREDVERDAYIVNKLFPYYKSYWASQDQNRVPVLQEESFEIPYTIPSGKTVILKGRFDAAFKPNRMSQSIFLKENKTKGTIDESGILDQLYEDLQCGFYSTALEKWIETNQPDCRLEGIVYNVIRRPLGAKDSPRLRKDETQHSLIERAFHGEVGKKANPSSKYPIDKNLDQWFKRWRVNLTGVSLTNFQNTILNGLLEQLCTWWDSIQDDIHDPWHTTQIQKLGVQAPMYLPKRVPNPNHWRRPRGVYDELAFDQRGGFYKYCTTGSTAGLERVSEEETNG